MLNNQAQACESVNALPSASRSAGTANGSWIAVGKYEGDLAFVINTGAVTGSVVYKLQDATDDSGTGAADISGATTGSITTANSATVLSWAAGNTRSHVRVVATVTTGPVLCGATLMAHPKYVG